MGEAVVLKDSPLDEYLQAVGSANSDWGVDTSISHGLDSETDFGPNGRVLWRGKRKKSDKLRELYTSDGNKTKSAKFVYIFAVFLNADMSNFLDRFQS
jgi:hypothetical protein